MNPIYTVTPTVDCKNAMFDYHSSFIYHKHDILHNYEKLNMQIVWIYSECLKTEEVLQFTNFMLYCLKYTGIPL